MDLIKKIKIIFLDPPDDTVMRKALYYLDLTNYGKEPSLIKKKIASKRTRHVFKVEINGSNYFFKKYTNYSYLKIVQDFFRSNRAVRAFETALYLNRNNIETVIPVLTIYKFFGKSSIFVTKECKADSLKDIFLKDISDETKHKLVKKLAVLYNSLLKLGIFHRDPNLSNFLFSNDNIVLIDMDDIKKKKLFPFSKAFMNIEKLNRILLLSYVRKKDLSFNNNDRIFIIKSLIQKRFKIFNENFFLKILNRFTKFKMNKYLYKKNGIKSYLRGGTIKDVDCCLFK